MIIGLTGSIGSGKSTVGLHLASLGAEVLDADVIAAQVVSPGTPELEKIRKIFGEQVIKDNGHLDRLKISSIVFKDINALSKLEEIIHPKVKSIISDKVKEYRRDMGKSKVLVVEVPLLIESGMQGLVDEVWVVIAEKEKQIERVVKRSKLSRDEVLKRINAQMSQQEKSSYANRVIDNTGSIEQTILQVEDIWKSLRMGS